MRAADIEAKIASKYLTEQSGWAFLREVTIEIKVSRADFRRDTAEKPQDFDARFVAYLAGRASRAEYELRNGVPR